MKLIIIHLVRAPRYSFIFYSIFMTVYSVYAFHNYFTRETVETFSLEPMSQLSPIQINISAECTHRWQCYQNATRPPNGSWTWSATCTKHV